MNFLDVPRNFFIIDIRAPKLLRGLTISGFRKADVIHALEVAIMKDDLETACRWAVEMHASGQMDLLWDTIFTVACKLINIMNPNMYLLIWNRYQKYKHLSEWVQKKYQYELRNNQEMRNIVAEIISIITLSKKNKLLMHPPPIYDSDFHHQIIKEHCVSEDFTEIERFTSEEEDDKEVILAANEILNVLRFNMNTSAIYWYHWLDKLTILKRKENGGQMKCKVRKINQIKESYWTDWVWILWNILLEQSKLIPSIEKHVRILYNYYKHNFSTTTRRHKHVIVSTAILFIKYEINGQLAWDTQVIRNYATYLQAIGNINLIYKALYDNLEMHHGDYATILKYKMSSVQFTKYLKKFQKEYNEEAVQSNFKTRLFEGIVTYKDPIKTQQSIQATHHHIKHSDSGGGGEAPIYNLLKKGEKSPPFHGKEMNILEYYQQPIAKSMEPSILISEMPHIPRKKLQHPNVVSMHPEHIKVIKDNNGGDAELKEISIDVD